MKTLCTLFIALVSLQIAFTQDVAAVIKSSATEIEMPPSAETPAMIATDTRAIKELSDKMKRYLKLPERVFEFNISGRAMFNVYVDANGKITQVETLESLGSDVDNSIVKALQRVKKVKPLVINGKKQARTIQLPVVIK